MAFVRTADRWVPAMTPGAPVRLFCLPYAGGGASIFRSWAAPRPPAGLQLCPIQLPEREERLREPAPRRVTTAVAQLTAALERHLDRPYAIFGHSMGALLAFELAREFQRRGIRAPVRLFLSAHRAPNLPPGRSPLHTLDDPSLIAELRRLSGTPDEVLAHDELMALALPTLRADFELCETYEYVPGSPLRVPLTIMAGADDPEVPLASLDDWRHASSCAVTRRIFPGDHFYLRDSPAAILGAIREDLGL